MQPQQKQIKKGTGRWSKQEHERFMLGIVQYGKDWKKVQQVVATRSGSQVRSHAQKFFNRLQKQQPKNKKIDNCEQRQQVSQTENDYMKSINHDDLSMVTPVEIVSLIRKQSKEDKTIHVSDFMKKLQTLGNQDDKIHQQQQNTLQKSKQQYSVIQNNKNNSFMGFNNILKAYENLNAQKKNQYQNQSFLISLTRKYKKYFAGGGKFQNLVDLKNVNQIKKVQQSIRKKSFTLLQGQDDDQKLQNIKKKINIEDFQNHVQVKKQQKQLKLIDDKNQKSQKTEQSNVDKLVINQ